MKNKGHYFRNGVLATALVGLGGGFEYLRLVLASRRPGRASAMTLRKILLYARNSEYGREHHFSEILMAKSNKELLERWQKNVKLNDYEDFRPLVERHKHGEENVLFPGKPVMYATTSGTTSEPKWIPLTRLYIWNVYKKMTRVWLYNFVKNRPKALYGNLLTIVGRDVEGHAPDGTVYGSVSGVTRADAPPFIKYLYACPDCVYAIGDYTAKYYAINRISMEKNLHMIVTANPSTIVEMQNSIDRWYDEMVDDIEKGTLTDKIKLEPEIREQILKVLSPNPERAEELRALKEKHGRVLPKHIWPNMQMMDTWKCGNTKIFLDKFKDSFPEHMFHQELGYFSSECRFGLVVDDSIYTVLFPHMHYYEFVAEEDLDAAKRGEAVRYWQVDEIEEGKRYCPYVTTLAGLYRYNMNDLVQVGSKFHNTPRVFMIQKINGIVSITGEKLHEKQFFDAVALASKELGVKVKFAIGFAVPEESRYHFYYEFEDPSVGGEQMERLNLKVDTILQKENIEYESKRDSFRLEVPAAHKLVPDAFEKFKTACLAEGMRDGQFKLNLLLQDEKRHAKFKQLVSE